MPSTYSRRTLLATGSIVTASALSGCSRILLGSSSSPLTIRATAGADREYRLGLQVMKVDATDYTEAKVVDETYMLEPAQEGFRTLEEIENRRYVVRARLSGMGYFSEQFNYRYYPSCGNDDRLTPTLTLAVHSASEQGHPYIGFDQAECQ